jgi:hypothetical protein
MGAGPPVSDLLVKNVMGMNGAAPPGFAEVRTSGSRVSA